MKHIFHVYNLSVEKKDNINWFINNLYNEFKLWGYKIYSDNPADYEICFAVIDDINKPNEYESESIVVVSDDSICHNEADFGSGNDIWTLPSKIDAIIVTGTNPDFTQFSIRTPLFKFTKTNFTKLSSVLINKNT